MSGKDSRGSYLEEVISQLVTADLMDGGEWECKGISLDTSLIKFVLYL